MDFYAEAEKRKQKRLSRIGELAYERFGLAKAIEDAELKIEAIDTEITAHEEAIGEIDQQQRNFNSYLAIKEGALTTEDIADGVRAAAEADAGSPGAEENTAG